MTNVREILDALKNSLYSCTVTHLKYNGKYYIFIVRILHFKPHILIKNISQILALKNNERVNQSLKLLCTVLGRIMPTDLSEALRLFLAAGTTVRFRLVSFMFIVQRYTSRCKEKFY